MFLELEKSPIGMDDLKNTHEGGDGEWKDIARAYRNEIRRFFIDEDPSQDLDSVNEFYKNLIQTKLNYITRKYIIERYQSLKMKILFQSRAVRGSTATRGDQQQVLDIVINNDSAEGADITCDFAHLGSKLTIRNFALFVFFRIELTYFFSGHWKTPSNTELVRERVSHLFNL